MNDCTCVFQKTGRRGQQSVMQQSHGQEKETLKRTEMGTRGSEGARREVADRDRKISRRGS